VLNMHRFFSGRWRESPFRKGGLKYVILDLIKDKPRYGYEIIRAIEERSHGFYTPSPGAVYPTLQLLEETGHVTAVHQDSKKTYTITDEGCRFLAQREHFAEEIKSQMRNWWNPDSIAEMGETMREFGNLGRLISQQGRRAATDKVQRVRGVISRAYNDIETILKE